MNRSFKVVSCVVISIALSGLSQGGTRGKTTPAKAPEKTTPLLDSNTYAGLKFRSIGPALTSGRIADIAVNPERPAEFWIAAASGGVWKTTNDGTTFKPVFDSEGSYSIGCITVDPTNPSVVWVGTGENNSQRSVSFGDGVYRTDDGGIHWKNMGLKASEHIAKILIDPRNSKVVWVAAQGPLWRDGGDRGLYKTVDGGVTWKKVLAISPRTGVTDLVMDPRDPDVVVAAAYQRRRHVWTLIDGGPESAVYKTTDGGTSWRKITNGLPKDVDLGRIGLAMAPSNPDILYAIVEAAEGKGGVFRSTDRGETWVKRSTYMSASPQYYNELVVDPNDAGRVYSMDTFLHVSEDGGATWKKVPENHKHVDNHALWIDPQDSRHLRAGCDGGFYESHDRGASWSFAGNLPITQFYRVAVDTSRPFYFVYGGTQDNATLGGPSATINDSGIVNNDWFVTVFGDGFRPAIDPEDPDMVYSETQYGGLVRYDRRTGEMVDIQPQPAPGEPPLRWNWDSPLIISPHSHTRLYFAAQKIYRSDDRGNSWRAVSPDLTRGLDRYELPVMGRIWSIDAVAKNASTSPYGNIVSLAESPLVEGLLYAGTDDGLIQISENGGATWRKIESFPGVPDRSYVSSIVASSHDPGTVYAAFDNHKMGDFEPYILKSTDRGRSWHSLAGDIPAPDYVHALAEDPVDGRLLFAGAELGLWCSFDGGGHWVQLKGGLPTVAVRDIAIQNERNDLVLATFGRGFYILDDLTPLREVSADLLARKQALLPLRDALLFVPRRPLGIHGKGFAGDAFYAADNPSFGAVFTYWLEDGLKTRAQARREREKSAEKRGEAPPKPSWAELRAEDREEKPQLILTVRDAGGAVIRRVTGPCTRGFHRVAWDLRYPPSTPVSLKKKERAPWDAPDTGPLVAPGSYTVTLGTLSDGALRELTRPVHFAVKALYAAAPPDRKTVASFRSRVARLQGAAHGLLEAARETRTRLEKIGKALLLTPAADPELIARVQRLQEQLDGILTALRGDRTLSKRWAPVSPSVVQRVDRVVESVWSSSEPPTRTQRKAVEYAEEGLKEQLTAFRKLVGVEIPAIEEGLEGAGAPWTPCRVPEWPPN